MKMRFEMKKSYRGLEFAEYIFFIVCLLIFALDQVSFLRQHFRAFLSLMANAALVLQVLAFSVIFVCLPNLLVLLLRSRSHRTPRMFIIGLLGLVIIFVSGFWMMNLFLITLSPKN